MLQYSIMLGFLPIIEISEAGITKPNLDAEIAFSLRHDFESSSGFAP
jgi:hypothetical protein